MSWLSFTLPHLGGTWTVARSLRTGLAARGITVSWVGFGDKGQRAWMDPAFKKERAHGRTLPICPHDPSWAVRVCEYVNSSAIEGVFIDVLGSPEATNLVRYLPANVLRLMIVHSITPGTYAAAHAVKEWVHATVCVCPRAREDLVGAYAFDPARTWVVPNASEVAPRVDPRTANPKAGCKVLFLGRIEDAAKGVFWLPSIMRKLPPCFSLTVCGDGPDLAKLKGRCAGDPRVVFAGAVPPSQVSGYMGEHDVFLMPSRYEGHPLSLIEAMSSGCVAVASRISGVTDQMISDGITGYLVGIGDTSGAAARIRLLGENDALRLQISRDGAAHIRARYTVDRMADAYQRIILNLRRAPPDIASPIEIARWKLPRGLRRSARSFLPSWAKNAARKWLEARR